MGFSFSFSSAQVGPRALFMQSKYSIIAELLPSTLTLLLMHISQELTMLSSLFTTLLNILFHNASLQIFSFFIMSYQSCYYCYFFVDVVYIF